MTMVKELYKAFKEAQTKNEKRHSTLEEQLAQLNAKVGQLVTSIEDFKFIRF